jgi:hypothetical protein
VESEEVNQSTQDAKTAGVTADFSVDSIPALFAWLLQSIEPLAKDPDPEMPGWMREAHESMGGFIDLADESKPLVLRASYYLGESFVRSFPILTWGLGRPGVAQYHMPVITGFADDDEMAPMLVAENLVRRSLSSRDFFGPVEEAVSVWTKTALAKSRKK